MAGGRPAKEASRAYCEEAVGSLEKCFNTTGGCAASEVRAGERPRQESSVSQLAPGNTPLLLARSRIRMLRDLRRLFLCPDLRKQTATAQHRPHRARAG